MKTAIQLSSGAKGTLISKPSDVGYLLYFHGGGFIYGSKNDLPEPLVTIFQKQKFSILALDYLLAPNSSLSEIIQSTFDNFLELKDTVIKDSPFSFCGRSAGGYLMLALTKKLIENKQALPEKLINFYGYTDLEFIQTKREISNYSVTPDMIQSINLKEQTWDDPLFQRYLLYIYGVQNQKLTDYYQISADQKEALAISPEMLAQFPPTFSTASTTDMEVPFRYSKRLKNIPHSQFRAVYDLPHDFLKETENEQVRTLMTELESWLKK